jgi:hypothetical protein
LPIEAEQGGATFQTDKKNENVYIVGVHWSKNMQIWAKLGRQ